MPRAGQRKDLTGKTFGMFTVLRFSHSAKRARGSRSFWICQCVCGSERAYLSDNITGFKTKSCGCLRYDATSRKATVHGDYGSHEYHAWRSMKSRCNNPKNKSYARYGGRGIKVCRRWTIYDNFLADMGRRPSPEHSLHRIKNDRHYTPKNCCWATRKEQARNRHSNRILELGGQKKTLAEWSEMYGKNPITVLKRLNRGWSLRKALRKPLRDNGYRR